MSLFKRLTSILAPGEEPAPPAPAAVPPAAERPVHSAAVAEALQVLTGELAAIDEKLARVNAIETAVAGLLPMVQFLAKAVDRSDRARDQQMVELRAHLTAETDRLASTLRLDAARSASLEIFSAILPALDEIDDVLRAYGDRAEAGTGIAALQALRRRLRDTFERLGIRELGGIERGVPFDPTLHEGVPCGDDVAAGVPSGGIVDVTRVGYRHGDQLIRAARVLVAP
jgi:molecular chaperone GrpE (heat shock protein)